MTADRDTTRFVRSWLRTDEHESADRVLQTVLSRLDTTPQRRRSGPVRRFLPVIGAAAVVTLAIGSSLVARSSDVGPSAPPSPSVMPSTRSLEPNPIGMQVAWNQSALKDERYVVNASLPATVMILAPGWGATDNGWVITGPNGGEAPDGMAIRFYVVTGVVADPGGPSASYVPGVGPTVADLVETIVAHPSWEASQPTDVTIDGLPGRSVRISIPDGASFDREGRFDLFVGLDEQRIGGVAIGQTFDLYILEAFGERMVIDAYGFPGTTVADLQARQTVLDALEIDSVARLRAYRSFRTSPERRCGCARRRCRGPRRACARPAGRASPRRRAPRLLRTVVGVLVGVPPLDGSGSTRAIESRTQVAVALVVRRVVPGRVRAVVEARARGR